MNINLNENDIDISLDNKGMGISLEMPTNNIVVQAPSEDIELENKGLNLNLGAERIVTGDTDHSKLENLDYEHSGHTGFQPSGNYVEDNNYIHTDNNFTNTYKNKVDNTNVFYGVCSSNHLSQTRSVNIDNFILQIGTRLRILFTTAQEYAQAGDIFLYVTGQNVTAVAKPMYISKTQRIYKYVWQAGEVVEFVYDGTNYVMVGKMQATTTYYGITKLNSSTTSSSQTEASTPYAVKQAYDVATEVHTDYYDTIVTDGDGDKYLADDGTYKTVSGGGGSGDLKIPEIRIQLKTNDDGDRLLYLEFGKATDNFINYVKDNGVEIHLLKYIRQGKKVWGTESDDRGVRYKRNVKKWVHPQNHYEPEHPNVQCWGIRSFERFEQYEGQIDDIIGDAEYEIPNDGVVQSEYVLTYNNFKRGYKMIKLNDIMACIIKKAERSNEFTHDMIPYEGDGDNVRIIGCRMSSRRARQRQPIKFVFAIRPNGKLVYGDGNVALLELFKYRLTDEEGEPREKGYAGTGILPDIGYGVIIK